MNSILEKMLLKYECKSLADYQNALKEIIQEIALLGLSRAKFFEHAAFYGGTALRILYNLDRFSEDLDFSLLKPDPEFKIEQYLQAVSDEIQSVGLQVTIGEKIKNIETSIQSAFIKAGTVNNLIEVNVPRQLVSSLHHHQQFKIKLEIDTDPPPNFNTKARHLIQPIPFSILAYDLPDLFAGKIHAMLCRQWKTRIKGRDWYDFIWFIGRGIPVHLDYLRTRLDRESLTKDEMLALLRDKINTIDFELAKQDVLPFLKDPFAILPWSKEFFIDIIERVDVK